MPRAGYFDLAVEEWDSALRLRLVGEFDLAVVGRVEDVLDRVLQGPVTRRVVLDLRGLVFLDAAGLRTILSANERARAGGFELQS